MNEQPKLLPALICGQIAMYCGAKAGLVVGSLFGPVGALIGCYIGGFGAELCAMSRSFRSQTPYTDAAKAAIGLSLNVLPDAATELALQPDTAVASQPAAPRRMSLLERIAAGQGAAASPARTFRGELS